MPVYEFKCKRCDKEFELQRAVAKMPATAKCPACGARAPRVLSMFAFVRGAQADVGTDDMGPEDLLGGGMDDDFGGMDDDFDF